MGPLGVAAFAAPLVLIEVKSPVIGLQLAQLSRHPFRSLGAAERGNDLPMYSESREWRAGSLVRLLSAARSGGGEARPRPDREDRRAPPGSAGCGSAETRRCRAWPRACPG